jgi:hypothetical protein
MATPSIEGVSTERLERCIKKLEEVARWSASEKIDRWTFRAALIKALYDDADRYFATGEGTFRELAAFDNGVATAIKTAKNASRKD